MTNTFKKIDRESAYEILKAKIERADAEEPREKHRNKEKKLREQPPESEEVLQPVQKKQL